MTTTSKSADRNAVRVRGTMKWFDYTKGYGFIAREAAPDCFAHISQFEHGLQPSEGDRVEFYETRDDRGRSQALRIKIL